MGYDECIEAAGVPVLSYHEDGSYQGTWFAYTDRGFYSGRYGTCGGCDWRRSEHDSSSAGYGETARRAIDAGIGRKILEAPPMSLPQVLAYMEDSASVENREECIAWARRCVGHVDPPLPPQDDPSPVVLL